MNIAEKYIEELKKAYYKNGGKEMWDNIEKIKEGASEENIKKLKEEYPEVPDSLIELLNETSFFIIHIVNNVYAECFCAAFT